MEEEIKEVIQALNEFIDNNSNKKFDNDSDEQFAAGGISTAILVRSLLNSILKKEGKQCQ